MPILIYPPTEAMPGGGKRTCRFVVGTSTTGWTAKDCDYLCDGTDDQVEINAAIQALPATGGEVVILDGTYNITNSVILNKDNVLLRGCGAGTVLKRMASMFSNYGVVYIRGGHCTVKELAVSGNKGAYHDGYDHGILLNENECTICQVECFNCYGSGIEVDGSKNSITNSAFTGNHTSGILLTSASNNSILGNRCTGNDHAGIKLNASVQNIIDGNMVTPNGTYTIFMEATGNNYNLISNNLIMGKNYVADGGTGNTFVNNKYN